MLNFMIGCFGLFNDTTSAIMEVEFFRYMLVLLIFMVCIGVFKVAARTAKRM